MKIIENVLTDRGSKYVVSGGTVTSKEEALAFVRRLCRKKKFAKTTHNAWAAILPDGTPLKNDDGERPGPGWVWRVSQTLQWSVLASERAEPRSILRMLGREEVIGQIVVVTRWYGGVKLGGDRFRRVQDCVRVWFGKQSASD